MIEQSGTHAATSAMLSWLMRARIGVVPADPADGSITMDFGRGYRATLVVLLGLATAALIGFGIVVRHDPVAESIILGIFGLLWLGLVYSVYDAFLVQLKASSRGIESMSPLTGKRLLRWESLQSTAYSSNANWYTFRSNEGWAIRISIYRNGLKSFSALVSANITRGPAQSAPSGFYAHMG